MEIFSEIGFPKRNKGAGQDMLSASFFKGGGEVLKS